MAPEAAAADVNGHFTEDELRVVGEELGRSLPPGAVVWLEGELGAGKTTLAQAMARGRGVRTPATSPTYDIVHHYEGARGAVYHVDCYRLRQAGEAGDLDWATISAGDLLLIEWPERAGEWALAPTVRISLKHGEDETVRLVATR